MLSVGSESSMVGDIVGAVDVDCSSSSSDSSFCVVGDGKKNGSSSISKKNSPGR